MRYKYMFDTIIPAGSQQTLFPKCMHSGTVGRSWCTDHINYPRILYFHHVEETSSCSWNFLKMNMRNYYLNISSGSQHCSLNQVKWIFIQKKGNLQTEKSKVHQHNKLLSQMNFALHQHQPHLFMLGHILLPG